ncbi:condensation domain-containing protein [Amycolatopsis alba]|uniref:condensation domain-containing protein n=1 Tax=Amycolatopsis alba TaxID=76020 RepID=UPI0011787E22|nr:condensation domain-containing protein [Amycolatopsis alba]
MKATPDPATVIRSGPLSWVQQWHWFERTIPAPRRVNPTPLADHCHVPPPATVSDVHMALASLTARHEALRSTIGPLRPVQRVHRPDWAPLPIDHVDVPAVDAGTLEAATAALAARPIDPERNPPWLARVLLEAGKPRAVLIAAHHVMIDGWGLAVLLDQLHDRLRGADGPAETALHPLDAIAEQNLERARLSECEWLARLADNPTGVLAPFGGIADGKGRHRLQYRSVEAYDDLDRVARRHRASPEIVVLAALAHEVATRTGEHRFLASVVVSNRARAALRTSVDVRALTVPVQIDLQPGAAFGEVVASVATASTAGYRHGRYRPAELVAAWSRQDRRRGVVAIPTIEFNCYAWPRGYLVPTRTTPPGGDATWISSAPDEPCETLYVDFSRDAGFITLDVTVGDHLLDAAQAVALPERLCGLLHALAGGAECPVLSDPRTPAASGWWRAPQGWACLTTVEDVLQSHPGVLDVTVTPSGGTSGEGDRPHLVARARVTPGVTIDELHQHVLDHLGDVPGLLTPGRYILSPAEHGTATGGSSVPPMSSRLAVTTSERALAAAVAAVVPDDSRQPSYDNPGSVDMNRCLADHGVTLVEIPRLLMLLRQSGYTGIAADELAGTVSLGHLAAALEPFPPRAHHGGETSS